MDMAPAGSLFSVLAVSCTYYKILSPDHNLVRTHAQYALVQSIEEQYDAMCEVIKTTTAKYRA